MGSITPVLTKEQKARIKSGELTEKQIERIKNSASTWRVEIPTGKGRDGKRHRYTETFHGSKKQAKRRQEELDAYYGTKNVRDRTLGAYVEEYMERKKGIVKDSTYEAISRKMRTILYMFGSDIKLSALTPHMIDDTLLEMMSKGAKQKRPCKSSYVYTIKATLGSLLKDAVKHGALASNPMDLTDEKLVKGKPEKRQIPATEDLLKLMRRLDVRQPRHMAIMLALTLGLRRQEAAALMFDDCDVKNGVIHIRRSVKEGIGEWVEETTKTEAGMRDLPMPAYFPELLERRREQLMGDLEVAKRAGRIDEEPEELYVCADEFGRRLKLTSITSYWCNHREGFGVKCAFHDLRHAYISVCAMSSLHPSAAAALAGHNDVRTTLNTYTHVPYDTLVEGVAAVSELFQKGLVEAPDVEEEPAAL